MVAVAGVLGELALGAGGSVEVKFYGDGLGFGCGFDLEDDGEIVSFYDSFVGD